MDGLFVLNNGIREETANSVKSFFSKSNFPWVQRFNRFPATAHYNWWRCGPYQGEEEQHEFESSYPEIYQLAHEAVDAMNRHLVEAEPNSSFLNFRAESVNVHLHKLNWGLGAHYDDSHDQGNGMVLMVSLGNEGDFPENKRQPRIFRFTDPVQGYQYDVKTTNSQIILFKDECYDLWRHESVRDKKQTGDCLSFTIRLKSIDGYENKADTGKYPKGAPFAAKMAHKRLRVLLGL